MDRQNSGLIIRHLCSSQPMRESVQGQATFYSALAVRPQVA